MPPERPTTAHQVRARRADDARRDAERRDHEARHARRVSVTVLQASGLSLELQIANNSDGPIFDVVPAYQGPTCATRFISLGSSG